MRPFSGPAVRGRSLQRGNKVTSSRASTGEMPPRVLLIGLDGATFSVLDPLCRHGFMPHLARLRARGISAPLRSTDPYVTAPAWTSLVTGKRPDTHGVFDWSVTQPGHYRRHMLDSTFRDAQAFWEILAARGLPAGSLNLPLTYPPCREASFCVADMFTPSLDADFVHPRGLKTELMHDGYQLDVRKRDFYGKGFFPFLRALTDVMEARSRAIQSCLSRFPWRASIVVFTETDRLQHAFWQHLDFENAGDPHVWSPEMRAAAGFYQDIDAALGRILLQVGEACHVYLVSDHGFGPHLGAFYINDWLEAQGYLVLKREPEAARMARRLGHGGLKRLGPRGLMLAQQLGNERVTKALVQGLEGIEHRLGEGLTHDAPAVDWEKTVAFADTPHGIQFNVRGREPQGCVAPEALDRLKQEVTARLLAERDPRSGLPIHAEVMDREARYWGEKTSLAPDLVYTFADFGYSWRIGRLEHVPFGHRLGSSFLAVETEWETGTHRPEGILVAAGPEIVSGGGLLGGEQGECHLWDVVPTLLYHLDEAIPPDLEGRVLRELLRPEVVASRGERWEGLAAVRMGRQGRAAEAWNGTDADGDAVATHLRGLGYLA